MGYYIMVLPYGYLAGLSLQLMDYVYKVGIANGKPVELPHWRYIGPGQSLTAVTSIVACAWSLGNFINYPDWKSRSSVFVSALMDLIFAVALFVGAGFQSTYMPHWIGFCSQADSFQLVEGTNSTNLFNLTGQIIADHSDYDPDADSSCQAFVTVWAFGIALAILSLIVSAITFRIGLKLPRVQRIGPGKIDKLASWLPRPLVTNLRYHIRYQQKRRQHRQALSKIKDNTEMFEISKTYRKPLGKISAPYPLDRFDMPLPSPIHDPWNRYPPDLSLAKQKRNLDALTQLLSSYPVLASIASSLHYADLVNLSLASHGVHATLFPNTDLSIDLAFLQRLTCLSHPKHRCYACNIQVCGEESMVPRAGHDVCSVPTLLPDPESTAHLSTCTPYCTACYKSYICGSHSVLRNKPQSDGNIYARCECVTTRAYLPQFLCSGCEAIPPRVYTQRHVLRRAKREERLLVRNGAEARTCAGCMVFLPKEGPRWWHCEVCQGECKSPVHPGWATG